MKRFGILIGCLVLAACGPEKFKEEVRQVEVGQTTVDEDFGELHVTIIDVETKATYDLNLGEECRQYPLPLGERFMTRFDVSKYEDSATLYYSPHGEPMRSYLCD